LGRKHATPLIPGPKSPFDPIKVSSSVFLLARRVPKMLTSHAVTMLLLHQCLIYTHFVRVTDGKMGVPGLWREKKMYNVSEPYLM